MGEVREFIIPKEWQISGTKSNADEVVKVVLREEYDAALENYNDMRAMYDKAVRELEENRYFQTREAAEKAYAYSEANKLRAENEKLREALRLQCKCMKHETYFDMCLSCEALNENKVDEGKSTYTAVNEAILALDGKAARNKENV